MRTLVENTKKMKTRVLDIIPAVHDPLKSPSKPYRLTSSNHVKVSGNIKSTKVACDPLGLTSNDPLSNAVDPLVVESSSFAVHAPAKSDKESSKLAREKRIAEEWSLRRKKGMKETIGGDIEQAAVSMLHDWNTGSRESALKTVVHCIQDLTNAEAAELSRRFFQTVDLVMSFRQVLDSRLRSADDSSRLELVENWYIQICTVRELLPRYFLETVLMSLDHFNGYYDSPEEKTRLRSTLYTISNPLLAMHAAMSLVKMLALKGIMGEDYLVVFNYCNACLGGLTEELLVNNEGMIKIVLDWIIGKLMDQIPGSMVMSLMQPGSRNHFHQTLVLQGLLCNVEKELVSEMTLKLVKLSLKSGSYQVLTGLGIALVKAGRELKNSKEILKLVWSKVEDFSLTEYVNCLVPWSEYIALHFGIRSLNTILVNFIQRVKDDDGGLEQNFSREADSIVRSLIPWIKVGDLIEMTCFNSLTALIKDDNTKLCLYIKLLEELKTTKTLCKSAATIQILLNIAKFVGSSVTALTPQDQERQISELVVVSIFASSLPRPEKQLQYLTECRAAFSHLDLVQVTLVRKVNQLSAKTTKKDHSLQQAMIAFSFITIPSIKSLQVQLGLYLTTAQLAFQSGCLGQGQACLAELILCFERLPILDNDQVFWFTSIVCNILSTLVAVPDNLDEEPLATVEKAFKSINSVKFNKSNVVKEMMMIHEIKLLQTMAKDEFPYRFSDLPGNDQIYAGEVAFIDKLEVVLQQLTSALRQKMKEYRENEQHQSLKEIHQLAHGQGLKV